MLVLVLGQPHKKCPSRRRGRGRGRSRGRRMRRRKLKAKCKAKAAVRGKTGDKDKVNYSAPYTQPNASSPQYTPHTPHLTPLTPVPMYAVIFGQNSRWDQTKRRDAPPLPPPPLTSLGWL